MLRALRSSSRPSFFVHSPLPSASMRTLPPAFWSRPHAAMTNASFTATHQISSTPLPFSLSKFFTKLGTCFAEQVGVYAPGTAKIAIFFPFAASATLMSFGLMGQPACASNSVDSESLPSGSLSPALIAMWGLLGVVRLFGGTLASRSSPALSKWLARAPVAWLYCRHAQRRGSRSGPPAQPRGGGPGAGRGRARAQAGRRQARRRPPAAPCGPSSPRRHRRPEVALGQAAAQAALARVAHAVARREDCDG